MSKKEVLLERRALKSDDLESGRRTAGSDQLIEAWSEIVSPGRTGSK